MVLDFNSIFVIAIGVILLLFNKKITNSLVRIYVYYLPFARKSYNILRKWKVPDPLAKDLCGIYEFEKVYPSKEFYITCRVISIVGGLFLIILGILYIFGVSRTLL